jgi:DnaJ-class molecular chaperone
MGKDNSENTIERSIKNKNFNPEKYSMVVCPCCNSQGYIQNPDRQCCPKCGGFGFIKKETKEDTNISTRNH